MVTKGQLNKKSHQIAATGADFSTALLDLMTTKQVSNQSLLIGIEPFLDAVASYGGKPFVERLQRYGRTDQGYKLILKPWYLESLEAVGDWRIPYVAVTGAAQTGKSLSAQLAFTDLAIHGRMPIGYVYADGKSLDKYVAQQFRPIANYWADAVEEQHDIVIRKRTDKQTNDPYQIGGVSFNFTLASTSKETNQTEGKSIISSSGASYTAAALGGDERSRWPHGADFSARTGASPIASRPNRDIGTYAGGNGISIFVNTCDRIFTQHYTCQKCGHYGPLSPKGCLLTRETITDNYGRKVQSYFTDEGRPIDRGWWFLDDKDPVKTAIIACSECGTEIPHDQRVNHSHMACRVTGETLRHYLDNIPEGFQTTDRIALEYSPLARENSEFLARQLIDKGLTCEDPRVWQQEDLGIVSTGKTNRLTMDILRPLIGAIWPESATPWRTVAGIDQGRGEHWLWIMEIYVRQDWRRLRWPDFSRLALRRVVFGSQVHRNEIESLLEAHGVDYGLVDNEHDTSWAADLCDRTGIIEMADQIHTQTDIALGETRSGGETFPCWKISNPVFQRRIITNCVEPCYDNAPSYRFPESWARYDGMSTGNSPLKHLMGPAFDPLQEKWVRPKDKKDDLFYAGLFAEAAMCRQFDMGPTSFEVSK